MVKPKCKLIGENGNVFNLIALVRRTLRENDMMQELQAFDADFDRLRENGGGYYDVLALFDQYVDVH